MPSISETAATPRLVAARWIVFLAVMAAIGLFVLRIAIARPRGRRVDGTRLRPSRSRSRSRSRVALVATPVYVLLATAQFSLRSAFDFGALVPLDATSRRSGAAISTSSSCLALFAARGARRDLGRPSGARAALGRRAARARRRAARRRAPRCSFPGVAGHAGQTSPRGARDRARLACTSRAGSVWIGGLVGLLVLWRSLRRRAGSPGWPSCVPRFSNVAFVAVLALIGDGHRRLDPAAADARVALADGYGQAMLVKIGLLLRRAAARRRQPAAHAAAAAGSRAARARRGAARAAAPARRRRGRARRRRGLRRGGADEPRRRPPRRSRTVGKRAANVGPGRGQRGRERRAATGSRPRHPEPRRHAEHASPSRSRGREAGAGADVTRVHDARHGDGPAGLPALRDRARAYGHAAPALVMVGHWGLSTSQITPPGKAVHVLLLDKAGG